MRLLSGKKRGEEGLRPLTEREIQERLYGSYRQEAPSLKEKAEEEFLDLSPSRPKPIILEPERTRQSFSWPMLNFQFPWREGISQITKVALALLEFSKTSIGRLATTWGLGFVIVACVFLGIQLLNTYRASVMTAPRSALRGESRPSSPLRKLGGVKEKVLTPPSIVTPAEETSQNPLPTSEQLLAPSSVPSSAPPPAKKKPASSGIEKPYVIQICTYLRREDAERLAERMKAEKLPAFVDVLRQRSNGKIFYPVFLGRFATFEEAESKLKEFQMKPTARDFRDSFVRAL